ncbi:hypothetical protein HPB48_016114 [Haemaphysalis longicornis]|uniref:Ionotropic receptor n=1 Tax=Haemaphysalis longicornis TaxID=44386 RepID=A0A9J6G964_HAELO|nr:hypothetical protein HPB48_016114 [Haemaphysalis longicornis]
MVSKNGGESQPNDVYRPCFVRYSQFLNAQLYPLVIDVMANLKDQEYVAIAAFGNASKLLAPHIPDLPKPMWLWTRFHHGPFKLSDVVLGHERQFSKVIVFLPWLSKEFPSFVENIAAHAIQTHWVISKDANKSFDWFPKSAKGACQVVYVSPTYVEEPVNGFTDCNVARRNTSFPAQLFRLRDADAKKYPRNLKLTIVGPNGRLDAVPEVAALLEAYAALNTSIIQTNDSFLPVGEYAIRSRDADLDVEPKPFFKKQEYNFYFHAMYPAFHICFFTRFVTRKGSSLLQDNANLVVLNLLFFVLALAIVFISRCVHSRVCPARVSAIIIFLLSTFVGRSPQTLRTAGPTLNALLSLWMFGTLIVGFYIQSLITTDIYAPSLSREVEDIQEFEKLLEARRVLPCVDFRFLMNALEYFETPLLEKLVSIIHARRNYCIPNHEDNAWYGVVHQGKHVYVRPCCSYDEYVALLQGVVKVRGSLQMYHRVDAMLSNLPQRRQHRRLLLAISESGMDFQHTNKVGPVHFNEGKVLIPHPFSNYMWVFATGCISAVLMLCFELVSFIVFRNCSLGCGR